MTTMELKPCPFCGALAAFEHLDDGRWSIGCTNTMEAACMGYQSLTSFPRQCEAIEAWNRRAPTPSPEGGEIAGLAGAVDRVSAIVLPPHGPFEHDVALILSALSKADQILARLSLQGLSQDQGREGYGASRDQSHTATAARAEDGHAGQQHSGEEI